MTDAELLSHFEKQPNGMWACIKPIKVGPLTMTPGVSVSPGVSIGGMNLANELEAATKRSGK